MENRYKIILSNNNLYKEIELPESADQVKVGTSVCLEEQWSLTVRR